MKARGNMAHAISAIRSIFSEMMGVLSVMFGTPQDEAALVSSWSGALECSEWDIFVMQAKKWNAEASVSDDFKVYLNFGEIPFYVRDLVRNPIPDEIL